jgi:hypothetical protein
LDHEELAAIEEIVGTTFVLLVPEKLEGVSKVEAYGNVSADVLECMVLAAGLSIMRRIEKNGEEAERSQ